MAFDQPTRNRLARFVSDARALIAGEFTDKFQSLYGISDKGELTPLEKLTHLDQTQLVTAALLRERIGYLVRSYPEEKDGVAPVVERLAREQAFTFVNRLAAIRMAEKRGLIVESIGRGYESKGFKVFSTVAGAGLGETHHRYRRYLYCLFDELAVDLGVLFDRRSPHGLLFPRENALLTLFDLINSPDLEALWGEDETIGWIYQYYNDPAERKKMRDQSAAPRSSRELAVRNQFFTPRYVVEFLTDNTLGRIWYEMVCGDTRLKEQCRYLVRRPNEIFLKPGETAPEQPEQDNLSQEELLKQPVHIPHRPVKDPRTILMLDPACGSMHFGLYAFDLFETIYDEAWELEEKRGADPLSRPAEMKSLHETYASKDGFLRNVPRLIIEDNIHGIDIDPRCVQIAGLSLWLRAHRAWKDQRIEPRERPQISRTNLVCAEPMPGEKELLREFVEQQFPAGERPAFAFLLEKIFDRMTLAGEAGSLLRIEEEIRTSIADAKRRWKEGPRHEQASLFSELGEKVGQGEMRLDLSGITDEQFWERAEQRIYDALEAYTEEAENGGGFQRRLFAEDAAQGFAFIDLCRKRYDVVVMNPPFGEFVEAAKLYSSLHFADSGEDIDAAFIARGREVLDAYGKLGVIANRTQFFKGVLRKWRERLFASEARLDAAIDLGYGVLDGAVVEAAAYILDVNAGARIPSVFIRALDATEKDRRLNNALESGMDNAKEGTVFIQQSEFFQEIPGKRLAYWITPSFARAFTSFPPLEGHKGLARQGLASADNFRFLRLAWEVPPEFVRASEPRDRDMTWVSFAKGGEYSPYFQDLHLVVNWNGNGLELSTFSGSVIRNPTFYFKEALTYSERTASGFSPRALPAGSIFDSKGPIVAALKRSDLPALLGVMMSRVWATFLEFLVAAGDSSVSGTAARQYTQSIVGSVPLPEFDVLTWKKIGELAIRAWEGQCKKDSLGECSRYFVTPSSACGDTQKKPTIRSQAEAEIRDKEDVDLAILSASSEIEMAVRQTYGFDNETCAEIDREFGEHPSCLPATAVESTEFAKLYAASEEELVAEIISASGGRRAATKRIYFADRRLELLCLHFGCNARVLVELRRRLQLERQEEANRVCEEVFSYAFGCAFGRWDIRYATGERPAPEFPDPFAPLPVCPPGMLQGDDGLPLTPEAGRGLRAEGRYPLDVAWDGVLVDDREHPLDLERRVHAALAVLWGGSSSSSTRADELEHEACALLGVPSLREWFRRPTGFFADHLKRYSKSRRQAPIYWPLSTASGRYTLWLSYHRLDDQILHKAIADFVDPKLKSVRAELSAVRESGKHGNRLEELLDFETELVEFRAELERIIKLPWKPNLNDGVLIIASPLWKLFGLRKWREDLQACWEELSNGDYDWAHLAHSIWPSRVEEKCKTDRSLAIAHGLEHLCKVEPPKPKKPKATKKKAEGPALDLQSAPS